MDLPANAEGLSYNQISYHDGDLHYMLSPAIQTVLINDHNNCRFDLQQSGTRQERARHIPTYLYPDRVSVLLDGETYVQL